MRGFLQVESLSGSTPARDGNCKRNANPENRATARIIDSVHRRGRWWAAAIRGKAANRCGTSVKHRDASTD